MSCLTWWALACLLLAPAAPRPEDPNKAPPSAEILRKALDQNISVDFQSLTLGAAIEALREQTKINFVLDRSNTGSQGINPDEAPVTLKLTNVRVRTVLKQLLNQYNLSWAIDQDLVLITSEATAIERQVRQRVSVDFDKVPLDQALRQLSRETNTNLVIDPRHAAKIKGPVTLRLDDVPLEIAVRLMAEMAGLRSVRQANVLFVTTRDVAQDLRREEEPLQPTQPNAPMLQFGGVFPPPPAIPAAAPPPAAPAPNNGNPPANGGNG